MLLPADGDFNVLIGGVLVIGDISLVPRPEVIAGFSAVDHPVPLLVGFLAKVNPPADPILLDLAFVVKPDTGQNPLRRLVEIEANAAGNFTIVYTLDESVPSLSPLNGLIYTGEFDVDGAGFGDRITVNAVAFPNDPPGPTNPFLPSDLETVVVMF
jgi:hypothetical protein